MKEATHMRRGKVIIDLATGEAKDHSSVNKAKRASRQMQMSADGRLGAGTVRLDTKAKRMGALELTKAMIKGLRSRRWH